MDINEIKVFRPDEICSYLTKSRPDKDAKAKFTREGFRCLGAGERGMGGLSRTAKYIPESIHILLSPVSCMRHCDFDEKILKGLICALLHLKPEQIKTIEITNPINLAGDVSGKEFILDINVLLNDDTLINLEMQVTNEYNWPERSLSYLCRAYDQLYSGQDYKEAHPVIHIGFLDFNLRREKPEFYATYKLMNVKTHGLYSDKFILSVVQLNHVELATEEDKAHGIDYWAKVFKAKTWEELKMYAKKNEYLEEAAEALYVANSDEIVRQQCRARKDAEIREQRLEYAIRKLEEKNTMLEDELVCLKREEERKRKLTDFLLAEKRYEDLQKANEDESFQKELFEMFGL